MNANIKHTAFTKAEIYTKLCDEAEKKRYTSYLRGTRCKTEDDFFHEISASFQFPFYFGENWAAMDECLCDLEWLSPSGVFVVIDDFTKMFAMQEKIQGILQDRVIKYFGIMIAYWESQNVPVEVWLNN